MSYRNEGGWKPSYGTSTDYYAREDDPYYHQPYHSRPLDYRSVDRTDDYHQYRGRGRGWERGRGRERGGAREYDNSDRDHRRRYSAQYSGDAEPLGRDASGSSTSKEQRSPRTSDSGRLGRRGSHGGSVDDGWPNRAIGAEPTRPRRSASPPARPASTRENGQEGTVMNGGSAYQGPSRGPRGGFKETSREAEQSRTALVNPSDREARRTSASLVEEGEVGRSNSPSLPRPVVRDTREAAPGKANSVTRVIAQEDRQQRSTSMEMTGPSISAPLARTEASSSLSSLPQHSRRYRDGLVELQKVAEKDRLSPPRRPDMQHLIDQYLAAVETRHERENAVRNAELELQTNQEWVDANPQFIDEFNDGPKARLDRQVEEAREAKDDAGRDVSDKLERIYGVLMTFAEDTSSAASTLATSNLAEKIFPLLEEQRTKNGSRDDQQIVSGESGVREGEQGVDVATPEPVASASGNLSSSSRPRRYGDDPDYDMLRDLIEEVREVSAATEASVEDLVKQTVHDVFHDIARRRREKGKDKDQSQSEAAEQVEHPATQGRLPLVQRSSLRSQSANLDGHSSIISESHLTLLHNDLSAKMRNEFDAFHEQLAQSFGRVEERFNQLKRAGDTDKGEALARDEAQQKEIENLKAMVNLAAGERIWLKEQIENLKASIKTTQAYLISLCSPPTTLQSTQAVTPHAIRQITQLPPTSQVVSTHFSQPVPGPSQPMTNAVMPGFPQVPATAQEDAMSGYERVVTLLSHHVECSIPWKSPPGEVIQHIEKQAQIISHHYVERLVSEEERRRYRSLPADIANRVYVRLAEFGKQTMGSSSFEQPTGGAQGSRGGAGSNLQTPSIAHQQQILPQQPGQQQPQQQQQQHLEVSSMRSASPHARPFQGITPDLSRHNVQQGRGSNGQTVLTNGNGSRPNSNPNPSIAPTEATHHRVMPAQASAIPAPERPALLHQPSSGTIDVQENENANENGNENGNENAIISEPQVEDKQEHKKSNHGMEGKDLGDAEEGEILS